MWFAEFTLKIDFGGGGTPAGRAGFVLFAAFLLSFAFIRMSTRLMRSPKVSWWPGSVNTGGVHIHHHVFGIVLTLAAGFVAIAFEPSSPWLEITAAVFGIGAGLTLDEFALWLHLDDVYWSEEGRQSLDAVLLAAILAGLVLTGIVPLSEEDTTSVLVTAGAALLVVGLAVVAMIKGKYFLGIAGLIFPMLSMIGAIRVAKPGSPWARWFYKPGSRRLRRAQRRAQRHNARMLRWQDRIGGAPDKPSPRKPLP
jgi:hypothetical protein